MSISLRALARWSWLAAFLTGCGGGDEGGSNESAGHDAAGAGGGAARDAAAQGDGGAAGSAGGISAAGAGGGRGGQGGGGGTGGRGGAGGGSDAGVRDAAKDSAAGGADGGAGRGAAGAGGGGRSDGGAGSPGKADGAVDCPAHGGITYTLERAASPTADQQSAYDKITGAMDEAVSYYNCYTNIVKALKISYVPSVQTADGNVNGSIRFGAVNTMQYITAMHEISHTVGIGSAEFDKLVSNGIFAGATATSQLRAITGKSDDVVNADTQHFWPYGLNYTSEVTSTADLVDHCKMVVAIRTDLGM